MRRVIDLLKKIKYILNGKQLTVSVMVLILTMVGSILECIGVSIIIPLISVILTPDVLMNNKWVKTTYFVNRFGYNGLVISIVVFVIAIYVVKNIFFVFLSWVRIKFACKIQREISIKILKSYMYRGYQFFLNSSYGALSRGVSGDPEALFDVLYSGLRLLSDVFTILLICIVLFISDFLLSIGIIFLAIICVVAIFLLFRKDMHSTGAKLRKYTASASQSLYHSFEGIQDILVLRKQRYFVNEYDYNKTKLQQAICRQTVGVEAPTYVIEGFFIVGIMLMVCVNIIFGNNTEGFVATLAAFAVGAFRILPSLGRISITLNKVMMCVPGINALYENVKEAENYSLKHPEMKSFDNDKNSVDNNITTFKNEIVVNNVSFSYSNTSSLVLNRVKLHIRKGESVGIIGTSGTGKTTLVNILLGLLKPTSGEITMDGINITKIPEDWSNIVGYIPQSVFLLSGSIKENVAFGCDKSEIDEDRVKEALNMAELGELINSLDDGIDTFVGDRGVRLSGGQRQRIVIARALYHNPDVLLMDEATSALDTETESAVISSINSFQGKITMIIVAHRLTTIKNCNRVYRVVNSHLEEVDKASLF